jgi:hypothetical protein
MDVESEKEEGSELSDFSHEEPKEKDFEYEILSAEEVMAKPLQMIEEVNEVLQVHPMLARQVLQYFNWNKENAVQRYFSEQEKVWSRLLLISSDNPCQIFREAKLPRPEDLKTLASLPSKVDCTICFETCAKKDVDALPCGHVFCRACWRDYLLVKVRPFVVFFSFFFSFLIGAARGDGADRVSGERVSSGDGRAERAAADGLGGRQEAVHQAGRQGLCPREKGHSLVPRQGVRVSWRIFFLFLFSF